MGAARGRPKGTGVRIGPTTPRAEAETEFGQVLRDIRLANRLTLREFASLMGYAPTSFVNFQKYESGEFLAPADVSIIVDWMHTLGYDVFSDETKAIVRAALKDHLEEVASGFARFIIEM